MWSQDLLTSPGGRPIILVLADKIPEPGCTSVFETSDGNLAVQIIISAVLHGHALCEAGLSGDQMDSFRVIPLYG
jgi:hypothetical protein